MGLECMCKMFAAGMMVYDGAGVCSVGKLRNSVCTFAEPLS